MVFKRAEKELRGEIAMLKQEVNAGKPSIQRLLELERQVREQEKLQREMLSLQQLLTAIPPEIMEAYTDTKTERKERSVRE